MQGVAESVVELVIHGVSLSAVESAGEVRRATRARECLAFDGADTDAEDLRGLRLSEVLEVTEHHYRPLPTWELCQGCSDVTFERDAVGRVAVWGFGRLCSRQLGVPLDADTRRRTS